MKKTKLKVSVLVLAVTVLALSPLITGAAVKSANQNVYIGPQDVVESNLYRAGNIIIIEGKINGDIFLAGNAITIKGPVAGNVFAVGSSIEISGPVAGNVFAAGSNINITGAVAGSLYAAGSSINNNSRVSHNAYTFGSNVILGDQAVVGWNLAAGGASVGIGGTIGRDADLFGSGISVNNKIGGNLNATLDEDGHLSLLPKANIIGNLTYKAKTQEQLKAEAGSVVAGQTKFDVLSKPQKTGDKYKFGPFFFFIKIIGIFGLIVVGLVVAAIIPKPMRRIAQAMKEKPWPSLGWGVVFLIVTPVLAVIVAFTVIGIPLAIIVITGYFIFLYLTKVFASLALGIFVFESLRKGKEAHLILSLIVGVVIFVIITNLPYIGWAIDLLLICWALGAAVSVKKELLKRINEG